MWSVPIALSSCLALANAFIPNIGNLNEQDRNSVPGHLSLPNLLEIKDINDLSLNWEFYNNIRYDTGRLLYESGKGALWSTPQLANTREEWTIETIFRYGQDGFNEDTNNGLSIWLIDPSNSDPIDANCATNFGGPARYDGFQILINSQDSVGLRIFAQDGSKPLTDTTLSSAIGSCDFNYLESDVPTTVRISYSKSRNFFKVQVDNNLCFRTELINIPESSGDFKFGVSGAISEASKNFFELFGIKVWTVVTSDAIDDHGLISSGVMDNDVPPSIENGIHPSAIRKSLMERQMEQHKQRQQAQDNNRELHHLKFDELYEKLSKIELAINNLQVISGSGSSSGTGSNEEMKKVEGYIRDIQDVESKQAIVLRDLQLAYSEFKSTLTSQYGNLLDLVSKLNERVMGEVREQQHGMNEIGKKVDLLMANHKEVLYQYQNSSQQPPSSSLQATIFYWLSIIAFLAAFGFVIFKYQEKRYKHSKIL